MCLNAVIQKFGVFNKDMVNGYKAFRVDDKRKLYGLCFNQTEIRKRNAWLDEKDFRETKDCATVITEINRGETYKTGWHIFTTLEDTKKWLRSLGLVSTNWCIYKCKGRRLRAKGMQQGLTVFVCKELFIGDKVK